MTEEQLREDVTQIARYNAGQTEKLPIISKELLDFLCENTYDLYAETKEDILDRIEDPNICSKEFIQNLLHSAKETNYSLLIVKLHAIGVPFEHFEIENLDLEMKKVIEELFAVEKDAKYLNQRTQEIDTLEEARYYYLQIAKQNAEKLPDLFIKAGSVYNSGIAISEAILAHHQQFSIDQLFTLIEKSGGRQERRHALIEAICIKIGTEEFMRLALKKIPSTLSQIFKIDAYYGLFEERRGYKFEHLKKSCFELFINIQSHKEDSCGAQFLIATMMKYAKIRDVAQLIKGIVDKRVRLSTENDWLTPFFQAILMHNGYKELISYSWSLSPDAFKVLVEYEDASEEEIACVLHNYSVGLTNYHVDEMIQIFAAKFGEQAAINYAINGSTRDISEVINYFALKKDCDSVMKVMKQCKHQESKNHSWMMGENHTQNYCNQVCELLAGEGRIAEVVDYLYLMSDKKLYNLLQDLNLFEEYSQYIPTERLIPVLSYRNRASDEEED